VDGFGSAWSAYKRWGDTVQYLPCSYGEAAPADAMRGQHVLVADFSWKQPIMEVLGEVAASIVVLDHHKSAQAELKEWITPDADWLAGWPVDTLLQEHFGGHDESVGLFPIIAHFDMERSGAALTWDFCHPDIPAPRLIEHIEDRDLWRFKLPCTREVHAAITSYDFDFARFNNFDDDLGSVISQGFAILRAHNKHVEEICSYSYATEIAGVPGVRVVNAPYFYASDCGHVLLNMFPNTPFSAVWSRRSDGKDQYSLRSEDSRLDVSEVAARMGGGGHRNASGFAVESGAKP
jgi:uncharacterized protein